MISSAVAIPDQPPAELSPPASPLKRRPSSTFDAQTLKKQRLDSSHPGRNPRLLSHSTDTVLLDYGPADVPTTSTSTSTSTSARQTTGRALSPPRRKSSLLTGAEEKQRGQRLFGALLGTLSQTTGSKPAATQRRREDIEKRQIGRLKAQREEREEELRRRKEALAAKRKEEQKRWDHECRQLRWANMRSMASFLQTTAEPRLYYRPWELREGEKAQIERQQEEVERQIEREMAEHNGGEPSLAAAKTEESRGDIRKSDASAVDPPAYGGRFQGGRGTMSATSGSGKKKPTSAAVNLVAGGGAGMMEALVCHPLDTIKVRMQLSRRKTGPGQKPRGFIQTGKDIVKKETVFGLYKGLGAVLTGIVPKMAIRFTSYEWYKQSLSDAQGNITPGRTFIGILSDPLDVPKYRSAPHALITVVREEGIGALYRGVSLTALRQGTNQAANFTAYSELKSLLQKLQPQYEGAQLPSWQTTIIGLISGAVGPFTNAPIDTIKTRLQKTPAQPGQTAIQRISLIARDMFRQEGPKAFYKGITPRVMRVAPGQAVTFTVYEFLKSHIENSNLPVTIESEALVPLDAVRFASPGNDLASSLSSLTPLLQPKQPIYLLIRTTTTAAAPLTAITYVPSTAPVRAKTLFASTRQSLVRSLGLDRFGDSVFVTDADEVTNPAEWAARERSKQKGQQPHDEQQEPDGDGDGDGNDELLSAKERELQRVRRAEEAERHGTAGRQLSGRPEQQQQGQQHGGASSGLEVRATDEARAALRGLAAGELVQLGLDLATETLVLLLRAPLAPAQVQANVPTDRPSYNFYWHPEAEAGALLFIYVCPGVSKVRERMMYASSRNGVIETAKAEGLAIAKRLELDADDLTPDRLAEEAGAAQLVEGLLGQSGQGDEDETKCM
ncbi:hypothetical protein DV735_g4413, partial [Chaetothyriales sp. CBS 134920]